MRLVVLMTQDWGLPPIGKRGQWKETEGAN
jgi:hypothetical protein